MLEQQIEERVRIGLLQIGEDRGIRRVAGLGLAGLGQLQLVEEHLLQLLRRAEVHLAADRRVRLAARGRRRAAPSSPENADELVVRDGDAGELHVGEGEQRRQLDVGQHRRDAVGQLGAQRVGDAQREPRQLPGVAPSVSGTSWVGSASGSFSSR